VQQHNAQVSIMDQLSGTHPAQLVGLAFLDGIKSGLLTLS
jgi:hypothetical protein